MKTAAWDFVSAHAEMFGIKRICRVLEVSRSGYYRWIAGAEARAGRQFEEDALVEEIREIHAEHRGNYGALRVHAELRGFGHTVNRKRVARLMRKHGIVGRHLRKKKRTTIPDRLAPPVADLVQRAVLTAPARRRPPVPEAIRPDLAARLETESGRAECSAGRWPRTCGPSHPGRVRTKQPGELRRRKLPGRTPVPGVQRLPGRDAQLHAGPLRALCRAVDPRPPLEPALRQLPLGAGQLLDDLVALRNPPSKPLLLAEGDREAVALQRGLGEHEQRVSRLARPGQLRRPELRLLDGPVHQGRQALRGHVQDQAAGAVRQHLPVLDVDDCQRTVLERRVGAARRGCGRGPLPRARTAPRR